jgi:hypothetical protein
MAPTNKTTALRGFSENRRSLLKHLAFYLACVLAMMLVPAWWHECDMAIFRAVHTSTPVDWRANHIALIDIPYPQDRQTSGEAADDSTIDPKMDQSDQKVTAYRRNILALLDRLATQDHPKLKAVLLDISFANRDAEIPELVAAIRRLEKKKVNVYAALRIADGNGRLTPKFMGSHAKDLYEALSDKGHTRFEGYDADTVWYAPAIEFPCAKEPCGGTELVRALVLVAAGIQDFSTDKQIYVNLGAPEAYRPYTVSFAAADSGTYGFFSYDKGVALTEDATQDAECLIVGSPKVDIEKVSGRPGPEIVAWALLDQIRTVGQGLPQRIVNQPGALLLLTFAFSLASAGVFGLLFRLRPRWRSKPLRLTLVSLVACAALLFGGVAMFALTGTTYSQLTLIVAGMLLTLGLCWHFSGQWLTRALLTDEVDIGPVEAEYDVFISYSRTEENAQWVIKNVVQPLTQAKTASGKPLRIFFDQSTIRPGTDWYVKLAKGINGCRVFLPIYSQDYFVKKFCRFEIKKAFIRRDGTEDEGLIYPLARSGAPVPDEFGHVHFHDVGKDPEFFDDLLAHVLGRVADGG